MHKPKLTRNRSDAWKPHEIELLVREWDKLSSTDIAAMLGRTPSATKTKAKELKVKKSKETLRMLSMQRNTGQFLKGHRPANDIPDLTVSVRTSTHGVPSKWIKLGLNNWQQFHHYVWQQAGNTIPEGYVLCFIDYDPLNCQLDNLVMIKRGQHQMHNHGIGQSTMADKRQRVREARSIAKKQEKAQHLAAQVSRRAANKDAALLAKLQAKERKKQLRQFKKTLKLMEKQLKVVKSEKAATSRQENDRSNRQLIIEREKQKLQKKVADKAIDAEKAMAKEKQLADKALEKQAKAKLKAIREHNERKAEREAKQVFKTKPIDITQLTPLRIDHNTVIFLKPGQDPEAVRAKYANRDTSRLHDQL